MAEVSSENEEVILDCEASEPDYNDVRHNKNVRQIVSLKENCIDCITKNFEMYNTAFLTTKDATLSRNLQFLQRRYSSRIILDLTGEELLDDRHLDFLINEHLKELDLRKLVNSGCTFEVIKSRMAAVGHAFAKVSFDVPCNVWEENVPEFVNQVICYLPNVEVLHVRQLCTDAILKNIAIFCKKLIELNIDGSLEVTNEGVKMLYSERDARTDCLSGMPLKVLSFCDTAVSEPGIVFLLQNISSLEVIHHNDLPIILYSMHKDSFKNNTLSSVKKYNLTKLDLSNRKSSNYPICLRSSILRVWTELCPNISTLYIDVDEKEYFDLVYRFSKLEHLTIECSSSISGPSSLDLNDFLKSNGAKLQSLQVGGFKFSVPALISSCPKLENLMLGNVDFESLGDTKTKFLNNLYELFLEDLSFSDQYAEDSVNTILQCSPKLEKIAFENCKFENSEMNTKLAKYCENNDIQHLRFHYCDINVPLLESIILTCSSLKTLTLESCENVGPDEAYNIQQLRNTTRSFVEIICTDYESEGLIYSDDDFFHENEDSDYEHYYDGYDVDDYDVDDDDVDEDDDPYLFYDYNSW